MEKGEELVLKTGTYRVMMMLNLTTIIDEYYYLNQSLKEFGNICNSTDVTIASCKKLNLLLEQHHYAIDKKIKLIEDLQFYLTNNHENQAQRSRRTLIGGLGQLFKGLFGTLDEEDGKYYDEELQKIHENENNLLMLQNSQTAIVKSVLTAANKMTNNTQILNEKLKKLSETLKVINTAREKSTLAMEVETLLIEILILFIDIKDKTDKIIQILLEPSHSLTAYVLPPEQFLNTLEKIKQTLKPDYDLVMPLKQENILHLYKTTTISLTIVQQHVFIQISIPIGLKKHFELVKLTPVPRLNINGQFASTAFIPNLIAVGNDNYFKIDSQFLTTCISLKSAKLCKTSNTFYKIRKDTCIGQILLKTNHNETLCQESALKESNELWVKLLEPNKWMFAFKNKTLVNIICGSKISNQVYLENSGFLEIEKDCFIETENAKLYSTPDLGNITTRTQFFQINLASRNLSKKLPEPNVFLDLFDEGLLKQDVFESTDIPTIHLKTLRKHTQISLGINIIWIMLVIAILLFFKGKKCFVFCKNLGHKKPPQEQENIQLENIQHENIQPEAKQNTNAINSLDNKPMVTTRTTTY
jgi:hypothetical protein